MATNLFDLIEQPKQGARAKRPIEPLTRNDLTLQLLIQAERIAREHHDGHLTIFRFTTEWKAMFGTPSDLRRQLNALDGHASLHEALRALVRGAKVK
jgi:hypothetical protein